MHAAPYTPQNSLSRVRELYGRKINYQTYYTPNHCQTLPPFHRLIILKITQGISSPFSLFTLCGSYSIAILYQNLNIGGQSKIYEDSFKIQLFVCDAVSYPLTRRRPQSRWSVRNTRMKLRV